MLLSVLQNFNTTDGVTAIVVFVIIPLVPLAFVVFNSLRKSGFDNFLSELNADLGNAVVKYSYLYLSINIILVLWLCVNQASICYKSGITIGYDVEYYLRVNSPQYNNYDTITSASSLSGLGTIKLTTTQRQLSSNQDISIIYYTSNHDDLLHSTNNYANLRHVCLTEKNILTKLACIVPNEVNSIIPTLFNSTSCQTLYSPEVLQTQFTTTQNSFYLQDNINPSNPESAIILSSFVSSTCTSLSVKEFEDLLYPLSVNGIELAFINNALLLSEFSNDIVNGIYLTGTALVISLCILIVGLRGIVTPIVTILCILLSMIAALGALPAGGYSSFSAFNVLSVYILLGVGATTVLIFAYSWRKVFDSTRDTHARLNKVNIHQKSKHLQNDEMDNDSSSKSLNAMRVTPPASAADNDELLDSERKHDNDSNSTRNLEIKSIHELEDDRIAKSKISLEKNQFVCTTPNSIVSSYQRIYPSTNDDCVNVNTNTEVAVAIQTDPWFTQISGEKVMEAYHMIALPAFFTALATYLSLFSKLVSPVVVISQLGLFMGTSYIIFYALFHYVIIPTWIVSSKFNWTRLLSLFSYSPGRRNSTIVSAAYDKISSANDSKNGFATRLSASTFQFVSIYRSSKTNRDFTENNKMAVADSSNHDTIANVASISNPANSPRRGNPNVDAKLILMDSVTGNDVEYVIVNNTSEPSESAFKTTAEEKHISSVSARNAFISTVHSVMSKLPVSVRVLGLIGLVVWAIVIMLVYMFGITKINLDFSVPQLFSPSTNLGQVLILQKDYKASIFSSSGSSRAAYTITSSSPTMQPSATRIPSVSQIPSARPSVRPSTQPFTPSTSPTLAPTFKPRTLKPTTTQPIAPFLSLTPMTPNDTSSKAPVSTINPTSSLFPTISLVPSPQPAISFGPNTNYLVSGCWGVSQVKTAIDMPATAAWNWNSFYPYIASKHLLADVSNICNYADFNRASLNLAPTWNVTRDCLASQIAAANYTLLHASPQDISSFASTFWGNYATDIVFVRMYWTELVLMYWASTARSTELLGGDYTYPLDKNGKAVTSAVIMPVWICANFSVQNDVDSLTTNFDVATNMINLWGDLFHDHSNYANSQDIKIIVASEAFQYPILAQEVTLSIEIALIISICGFICLILLFTRNISLTILGTLCMLTVLLITLGLKLTVFSAEFDLLDVVCLVAVVGMLVDFPVHLILHVFDVSDKLTFSTWHLSHQTKTNPVLPNEGSDREGEEKISDCNEVCEANSSNSRLEQQLYENQELLDALAKSTRYSVLALLIPLILIMSTGAILTGAIFTLLAKTGQYIVLLVCSSYILTFTLFPIIMLLSCRIPVEKIEKLFSVETVDDSQMQIQDFGSTIEICDSNQHVTHHSVEKEFV